MYHILLGRNKLVRKIIPFKYEKLLLFKLPQNKIASSIAVTEKNKASQTYNYIPVAF